MKIVALSVLIVRSLRTARSFLIACSICVCLLAACSRPNQTLKSPRLILFVTIDTLRADHFDFYGYPRATSPFISTLAERGVIFEKAYSASSHTAPSHATMFTSLFPFEHAVLKNHDTLAQEHFSLFHSLKNAGYRAVALPAVRFMEGKVGFPALDSAQDIPEAKISRKYWYRSATQQVNRALNILKSAQKSDKVFLWLHFYDVHEWAGKTSLPEKYHTIFDGSDADVVISHALEKHKIPLEFHTSRAKLLETMDNYDRRIRYVDDELNRLGAYLKERGLDESLLWIITADHGEGLGNHDYAGHGEHIYNEQLHIPLIFSSAREDRGGRRVKRMVRSVEILPTLLDILGLDVRGQLEKWRSRSLRGYSLWPLIKEGRDNGTEELRSDGTDMSFAQRRPKDTETFRKSWEEGDVFSLQSEEFKIIHHAQSADEFFDLVRDPFELNNIAGSGKPQEAFLKEKLMELLHSAPLAPAGTSPQDLTPEEVEELKTLGYM